MPSSDGDDEEGSNSSDKLQDDCIFKMPEIITKLNVKGTGTFLCIMVRNGHKLIFTHRIMKFAGIGWMSLDDAPSRTNF